MAERGSLRAELLESGKHLWNGKLVSDSNRLKGSFTGESVRSCLDIYCCITVTKPEPLELIEISAALRRGGSVGRLRMRAWDERRFPTSVALKSLQKNKNLLVPRLARSSYGEIVRQHRALSKSLRISRSPDGVYAGTARSLP